MREHKKVIILTIIFILIASVVWVMHLYGKKAPAPVAEEENSLLADIKVQQVPTSELPPELPKNLPLEPNAPIMRNEILDVSQGREVQHLRTYVSSKTVAENVKIYRDYFAKDGWKVAAESIQKDNATIIATKAGNTFKFTVSKNSITSDVTVELVITLRKTQ